MSRSKKTEYVVASKKKYGGKHYFCVNNQGTCDGELTLGLSDEYLFTTDVNEISSEFINFFKPLKVHSSEESARKCSQRSVDELNAKRCQQVDINRNI